MTAKNVAKTTGTAPARNIKMFSDDELLQLTDLDSVLARMAETFGDTLDIADLELGNGFTFTKDKSRLVNVPFVIVMTRFNVGTWDDFVSVLGVTTDGSFAKFGINDGGAGICRQVRRLTEVSGRNGGWTVRGGLRASTYDTCTVCGRPLPAYELGGVEVRHCHSEECAGKDVGLKRGTGTTYYLNSEPSSE